MILLRRTIVFIASMAFVTIVLAKIFWCRNATNISNNITTSDVSCLVETNTVRRVPQCFAERYENLLSGALILKRQDLSFVSSLAEHSESPLLNQHSALDSCLPLVSDLGKRLIESLETNRWETADKENILRSMHWIVVGLRRERDLLCLMTAINLEFLVFSWMENSSTNSLFHDIDPEVLMPFFENTGDNAFSLLASELTLRSRDMITKQEQAHPLRNLAQDFRRSGLEEGGITASHVERLQRELDQFSSMFGKAYIEIWNELIQNEARLMAQRYAVYVGLQHLWSKNHRECRKSRERLGSLIRGKVGN